MGGGAAAEAALLPVCSGIITECEPQEPVGSAAALARRHRLILIFPPLIILAPHLHHATADLVKLTRDPQAGQT